MPTLNVAIDATRARFGAKQFEDAKNSINRSARSVEDSTDRVQKKFGLLGAAAQKLKSSFLGLGAGIAGSLAFKEAITLTADFEQQLAVLAGVSQATAAEMQMFEKRARELGGSTQFSAAQAAEALLNLSRAGFNVAEANEAVAPALDLAVAGNIDLAQAADITAKSIRQFGLEAADAGRLADVLVTTANKANTDVIGLGESFKFSAGLARTLKVPLEETAAAIGVLGDNGIQGAMAGTNLRAIMSRLIKPTTQAQEVLDRAAAAAGLTADAFDLTKNSFTDVIRALKAGNLSEQDIISIFGSEALTSAVSLMDNVDRIAELTKANYEASGQAARNAKIAADTLSGAWKSLQSATEELMLVLTRDSGLSGVLKTVVETVAEVIQILGGAEGAFENASTAGQTLYLSLKAVAVGLAGIVVYQTANAIPALMSTLVTGFKTATLAVKGFTLALAANPIGLIAVAISAAVAALLYFKDTVINVGNETTTVGELIGAVFAELRDRIGVILNAIVKVFTGYVNQFAPAVDLAMTYIGNRVEDLFAAIRTAAPVFFDVIFGGAKRLANALVGLVVGVKDSILDVFGYIGQLGGALSNLDFSSTQAFVISFGQAAAQIASISSATLEDVQTNFADAMSRNYIEIAKDLGAGFMEMLKFSLKANGFTDAEVKEILAALDLTTFRQGVIDRLSSGSVLAASPNAKPGPTGDTGDPVAVTVMNPSLPEGIPAPGEDSRWSRDEEVTDVLSDFSDEVSAAGRNVSRALADVTLSANSAEDAFRSVAESIVRSFVEQGFQTLISGGMSGLAGALGNAFSGAGAAANGAVLRSGSLKTFAAGGTVLTGPVSFPLAGGMGLAGETSKPELGFFPLERKDGILGIRGSEGKRPINVNIQVVANNPSEFLGSEKQMMRRVKRGLDAAME